VAAKDALAQPITMGELYYAVQQGKQHKVPGIDLNQQMTTIVLDLQYCYGNQ
jgi:hypothetical protein